MISKKHPVANWVRLSPSEYRKALERVLDFRDKAPDPYASDAGSETAKAFFWEEELPQLMRRPDVRVFAQERIAELNARTAELRKRIEIHTNGMLSEIEAAEAEAARITSVMEKVQQ